LPDDALFTVSRDGIFVPRAQDVFNKRILAMRKAVAVSVSALATLFSTNALGAGAVGVSDQYTFDIRGFVPVICRASVEARTLREFCNNPNGYEVWLDHSPTLAGAAMVVDGRRIELSRGNATLLSRSDHAAVTARNLAMEMPRDGMTGHLSIRVVAL
jgi:hypothetical protein